MKPVPFREAQDQAEFGGKSAHLGSTLRAGLPVPDGVAISVDMVSAIVAGKESPIAALAECFNDLPLPLAVRSSGVGEDSAGSSFAGQYESYLNIRTLEQLLDAIKKVWLSGHNEGVMGYREKLGLSGKPQLGVAVQHLVVPDCSGVLFTRNPVTGADEIVIECAWGFGEVVVSGLVTPDYYSLDNRGNLLESTPGYKDVQLRMLEEGGLVEIETEAEQIEAPCLDDEKLRQLFQLAGRCVAEFGPGQDIEWAFVGERLYLLQQRPITTTH